MHIYLILNSVDWKYYIGKWEGPRLKVRWDMHLREVKYGSKTYLHNAIRKHGAENFSMFSLLEVSDKQQLRQAEIDIISALRANVVGYNLTLGGDGRVGYITPEEVRQKIGRANKGKEKTKEHRLKLSEARRGVRMPSMSRDVRKERNPMYGKKLPASALLILSEKAKQRALAKKQVISAN